MSRTSTVRVAGRLVRVDPRAYGHAWLLWVGFHTIPIPIGLAVKLAFDRIEGGGAVWTVLAAVAGLEAARWGLLVVAAVQFHGTWMGWLTVPRVNALGSLVHHPGPAAGRLPGSPGEAVSRFRDDTQDLAQVLDGWLDVSGSVIASSTALVIMAAIDPRAALAVALPVGGALAISWWLGPRLRAWRRSAREATAEVTGFIGDTFAGVLAIKATGAEDAVDRRFAALNDVRARVSRRDQLGSELVRSLGYGTGEVTVGVVLLLVAGAFRSGELSVGDIGLFAAYVTVIASLPKWVARLAAHQRQADVSVDRLAELLAERDRAGVVSKVPMHLRHGPPPLDAAVERPDQLEELHVEGLTVRHPSSGRGVEDVDLIVRRGELVVITGRVGAGKSTLLRGVLGLVGREAGTIRWNCVDVDEPSTWLVPPRVAYLPQVPRLFSESLAETILLGLPGDDLTRSLWLTCLDDDLADMPDGHDTVIGPRGLRLSGGQIQRTGAARALVRRPELLVVDDLSSALDVETEARLWDRLEDGGFRTALLVSHRDHVIRRADRVVVLEEGRVVEVREQRR